VGFRYGGDEFAVILPQCGLDDAQTIAAKLVVAMSGRAVAMRLGKEGSVSLSCGVADLKVGPDRLVEAADQGLLLAKAQGKGRVEAGGKPG
jgi:diguanylate cyclase (GGDEF)-like protein